MQLKRGRPRLRAFFLCPKKTGKIFSIFCHSGARSRVSVNRQDKKGRKGRKMRQMCYKITGFVANCHRCAACLSTDAASDCKFLFTVILSNDIKSLTVYTCCVIIYYGSHKLIEWQRAAGGVRRAVWRAIADWGRGYKWKKPFVAVRMRSAKLRVLK